MTEMNPKRMGSPPQPGGRGRTKRMTKQEMDAMLAIFEKWVESGQPRDDVLLRLAKEHSVVTRQIERYLQTARNRREQKHIRKVLKDVYPDYLKEHYAELNKIAKKLKDDLCSPILDSLLGQLYPAERLGLFRAETPWRFEQDKDRNRAIMRFNAEDSDPGLFSCLLSHLTYKPGTSRRFRTWQNDVSKLLERCHDVLKTITHQLKERTTLGVSETGGVGLRLSILAPFVLGRILLRDVHNDPCAQLKEEAAGELVELVLESGADRARMALGSARQIERCREAVRSIIDDCALDNSINRVITAAGDLEEHARTIANELDIMILGKTYQGTCRICASWITSQ
jgi:hypothetical protein